MPPITVKLSLALFALATLLFAAPANALRLVVAPEAHWLAHGGAALLLYSHIGAGAIGILTGLVASVSSKGSTLHRRAGVVFFWSMALCYTLGAGVAPFLDEQQSTNFVAAILALYLLISGVSAARRRRFIAGPQEKIGAAIASLITLVGAGFMMMSANSPDGSVDGSPPQAYILFVVAGCFALIGDILAIARKQLSPNQRIVRHLWRMCMSFFIAAGSAFFGQAQFFPVWFNASVLPLLLGFFPFMVMAVYCVKYWAKAIIQRHRQLSAQS